MELMAPARRLGKRLLDRDAWIHSARRGLCKGGIGAVRIDRLARDLKVTKGSYYWHFRDLADLHEELLASWERETAELVAVCEPVADGRGRIEFALRIVEQTTRAVESGGAPSDAAIYAWASMDKHVARRVNQVERQRVEFLKRALLAARIPQAAAAARAEIGIMAYIGYVIRCQRDRAFVAGYWTFAADLLAALFPEAT